MARKPTGRPTGRPNGVIDWQKFEFGCQINATKEEICKWLNVSETTLDAGYNAHYHRIVTACRALCRCRRRYRCPPSEGIASRWGRVGTEMLWNWPNRAHR